MLVYHFTQKTSIIAVRKLYAISHKNKLRFEILNLQCFVQVLVTFLFQERGNSQKES